MNVSITPELERFMQEKVKSGLYHSASEVVRDGLRLLIEQEHVLKQRRDQIDAKVKRGLDQLARGESVTLDESKSRLAGLRASQLKKRVP